MANENLLTSAAQNLLQQVRDLFGSSNVTVTSTGRSASHNNSIPGASQTSQHLTGNAFDFTVAGMTPLNVQDALASSGIGYGQSIAEFGAGMGPRNHLGVGTKLQNLIGNNGKYLPRVPSIMPDGTGNGSATARALFGDKVGTYISDILGGAGGVGDILKKPADALAFNANDWFLRIAFALIALLLIAFGLYMISQRPNVTLQPG